MAFHEVRFPTGISFGSRGGPQRKTFVSVSGSGYEHRNSQWADSKRTYNAGYGIKDIDDLNEVISFFEERRGRLHGFRWKDRSDWKSCKPTVTPNFDDQTIGAGDGSTTTFQLIKVYGSTNSYTRDIKKPVANSVVVGIDGVQQLSGWSVDTTTGVITFTTAPGSGLGVTAGYQFDVPVRFDTDYLEVDYSGFESGAIPDIPLVEIRI